MRLVFDEAKIIIKFFGLTSPFMTIQICKNPINGDWSAMTKAGILQSNLK
jgi:hypothetical protein